jgi:hypothetical protein
LGVAGATLVGVRQAEVQCFDCIHDEVDHVAGRSPVAQIWRQKQRAVVVDVDETGGHSLHPRKARALLRCDRAKSDRLLGC